MTANTLIRPIAMLVALAVLPFAHDAAATADDYLRVSVLYNGTKTPVWEMLGDGANANAAWTSASASLTPWKGKQIRLLIEASDGGTDNIVEAALDDVRVYKAE